MRKNRFDLLYIVKMIGNMVIEEKKLKTKNSDDWYLLSIIKIPMTKTQTISKAIKRQTKQF